MHVILQIPICGVGGGQHLYTPKESPDYFVTNSFAHPLHLDMLPTPLHPF